MVDRAGGRGGPGRNKGTQTGDKPRGWKPSMGLKKIPRKPGDVRDRPRVTKGTTTPVTVAQVKADKTIDPRDKEVIIRAIQRKRGQGGGPGK